jgi:hypothetical protein
MFAPVNHFFRRGDSQLVLRLLLSGQLPYACQQFDDVVSCVCVCMCNSAVDLNADYDSIEQLNRDAEDKYFDEDDGNGPDVKDSLECSVSDYDF